MKIIDRLKSPETKFIKDLDDPQVTLLHGQIVQKKVFLKKVYRDFYNRFKESVGDPSEKVLVELGSGGGFIKEVIDNVITSDILELGNVDKIFSATDMPFADSSVDTFFMFDVLHHIAEPEKFFSEALRVLKDSGKIVMIEPACTLWAQFIYKNFHHEPFDKNARWELEKKGPLSHANGAIPWIIFSRDRSIFERKFPDLKVIRMTNHTPLRYLLSGGFSFRQLIPSFLYPVVNMIEWILSPLNNLVGMFQMIELQKTTGKKS